MITSTSPTSPGAVFRVLGLAGVALLVLTAAATLLALSSTDASAQPLDDAVRLVVTQSSTADPAADFTFNPGIDPFTLNDGESYTILRSADSPTILVVQDNVEGWSTPVIDCGGDVLSTSVIGSGVSVLVEQGGTAECTFMNTPVAVPDGILTITQVSTADPTTEFGYGHGTTLRDGETDTITISFNAPLSFRQTNIPAGWSNPQIECTGDTNQWAISDTGVSGFIYAGERIDCTFTNSPLSTVASGIYPAVTCLGGNGRIDINLINQGDAPGLYRVTIGSLPARQNTINPNSWWRSPVTGRPDGPIQAIVTRDGQMVYSEVLNVQCDNNATVSSPEVQIMTYCVNGRGFVLAQMANPDATSQGYILDVGGIRRSQTAAPHGAAVRGVSGRPNGDLPVSVFADGVAIATETVTISC